MPSRRSVGIGRGLKGLGALFELGGFVVAAEFAEGLGFGGEVAKKIRALGAELLFFEGDHAGVAGGGFFGLAGGVVGLAKAGNGHTKLDAVRAVNRLENFQGALHDGLCLGVILLREINASEAAESARSLIAIFAVGFHVEVEGALKIGFG